MTVTKEAQAFLTELLRDSEGLIIGLTSGGCTGFKVSLKKTPLKDCSGSSIDDRGRVFIEDAQTQRILDGARLKLVEDPFSKGLHIVPPTGYLSCGCGESFAPKYGPETVNP